MSDNIRQDSVARKAGRGFLRILRALIGEKGLVKTGESLEALASEYRAGRGGEPEELPPRAISHKEVEPPPPPPDA